MKKIYLPLIVLLFLWGGFLAADEGMWLFSSPPQKEVLEKYGFEMTPKWLEQLQKSSVRVGNRGSGSFVSPNGLVMTNHHVGIDTIQKLSTKEKDYVKNGFYAPTFEDELPCPDLEFIVLQNIEDVTAIINAAVEPGMKPEEAEKARRAVMNEMERESQELTGLKSEVITLFQGGLYHLYRYKKYNDVRLVFAPEQAIAFFGGDPDNFEFPRYDLDVCFFRVYENDQPAHVEHFLNWSQSGAKEDELVFVAGHPGRTERGYTTSHLAFQRDVLQPNMLEKLRRRLYTLKTFAERNAENRRRVQDEIFSIDNYLKVRGGMLAGLQTPLFMEKKIAEEKSLQKTLKEQGHLPENADPWSVIDSALAKHKEIFLLHDLLETGSAFNSKLFGYARTLLRFVDEMEKPNSERLREYRESGAETLKQALFSPAPLYEDVEIVKLSDSLSMLVEQLGFDNPHVIKILNGQSPQQRARSLIKGTKLFSVEERKRLFEGGKEAIRSSEDPLLRLAASIDVQSRAVRKTYDDQVQEPLRQAYGQLTQAKYGLAGMNEYPDATFTLRLSYGKVKGYKEDDGSEVPAFTEMGGTFERAEEHDFQPPYHLPESWIQKRGALDAQTPMNLVTTNDIVGGNSGSPLVNKNLEVVGLIFDGNIYSLVSNYVHAEEQARAISVHSSAILQSLQKVYNAEKLAQELQQGK
ncbi:MAG: S46 family peptidase [Thermoguttaceae bacterium]